MKSGDNDFLGKADCSLLQFYSFAVARKRLLYTPASSFNQKPFSLSVKGGCITFADKIFYKIFFSTTFFYQPISLQDTSCFKYSCSHFKWDLLIHNTHCEMKIVFVFQSAVILGKPIRNVEGYEKAKYFQRS